MWQSFVLFWGAAGGRIFGLEMRETTLLALISTGKNSFDSSMMVVCSVGVIPGRSRIGLILGQQGMGFTLSVA